MTTHKGLPILTLPTQATWNDWLTGQGTSSPGAWLKFAKKGSGQTTPSKPEAIDKALAHGWVDGQLDKFDDHFWLVRFMRRRSRRRWSEVTRDIAARLLAEGRMTPAGRAAVEAAQRDGRWDAAYAPQSRAEVPDDLRAALDAEGAATKGGGLVRRGRSSLAGVACLVRCEKLALMTGTPSRRSSRSNLAPAVLIRSAGVWSREYRQAC